VHSGSGRALFLCTRVSAHPVFWVCVGCGLLTRIARQQICAAAGRAGGVLHRSLLGGTVSLNSTNEEAHAVLLCSDVHQSLGVGHHC
jgi:hypothetical protein